MFICVCVCVCEREREISCILVVILGEKYYYRVHQLAKRPASISSALSIQPRLVSKKKFFLQNKTNLMDILLIVELFIYLFYYL